jgi:hypothetical protein
MLQRTHTLTVEEKNQVSSENRKPVKRVQQDSQERNVMFKKESK